MLGSPEKIGSMYFFHERKMIYFKVVSFCSVQNVPLYSGDGEIEVSFHIFMK